MKHYYATTWTSGLAPPCTLSIKEVWRSQVKNKHGEVILCAKSLQLTDAADTGTLHRFRGNWKHSCNENPWNMQTSVMNVHSCIQLKVPWAKGSLKKEKSGNICLPCSSLAVRYILKTVSAHGWRHHSRHNGPLTNSISDHSSTLNPSAQFKAKYALPTAVAWGYLPATFYFLHFISKMYLCTVLHFPGQNVTTPSG